jgi:5'-deoxynucleotidase YfbR-like HD superfamily hydrolase
VVDPIHPSPGDFCIEDIAHALGNSCRFTGHVRSFYSVAEHSVRVSRLIYEHGPVAAMNGLLHDASEAYLSDIARPIKKFSDLGHAYEEVESRLQRAICAAFDTPWPLLDVVRWADNEVLRAEIRDLMPASSDPRLPEYTTKTSYRERIEPWSPEEASFRFEAEWSYLNQGKAEETT